MVKNEDVDKLEPLAAFKLPTEPYSKFLRADEYMVYFINYHNKQAQVYRDYFCEFATLILK